MTFQPLEIFGHGGDALSAPENTETAYWAALGGGASGLLIGVRLSADGVVVCSDHDDFGPTCGDNRKVRDLDWRAISGLDAGSVFRSTVLDDDNQPIGARGNDTPWLGNLPSKRAIRVQALRDVLGAFARRCQVMVTIPDGQPDLIAAVLSELRRSGLLTRVILLGGVDVCTTALDQEPQCRTILVGNTDEPPADQLQTAEAIGADGLCLEWTVACPADGGNVRIDPDLANLLTSGGPGLLLWSNTMHFAVPPPFFGALQGVRNVLGVAARGVLPTVEMATPSGLIVADDFVGNRIDRGIWTAGYSHTNQDTAISQDDGLHIVISDGGTYSGAAAVTTSPTHGRFDAQVEFHVSNPMNGTTFEIAAICIDPGYFEIDNSDLDSRSVNLTFDVHGAPPYASSERDEDDGFRCGWNNGFNLTRIDPNWSSSSANMYNKYGRDVGDGTVDSPEGKLRLVRNGPVFVSYYQDRHNSAWVCSGAMLVQNMSDDVFIRLAAKHWAKRGDPPPANHVTFRNFQLRSF